jgi:hypothetical protein
VVENGQSVPDRAGGDQTIDARSDRQPGSTRRSIEGDRFLEDRLAERRLDDREGPHRLTRRSEGDFVSKPLEHFLDHRQAGRCVVQLADVVEAEPGGLRETSIQIEVSTRSTPTPG